METKKNNKSINVIFNAFYYLLNSLFPIIIFPYVSRALGVEGIGAANLAITVAAYFTTIASLGIPIYGVREVAKRRNNRESLNQLVSELMMLNVIGVVISFVGFFFLISSIETMRENYILYIIASINIALSFFQIDWLFQGLENFKILAVRNAAVKVVSLLLVFSMVHNESDISAYVLVTTISLSCANIFNLFHATKVIKFTFTGLSIVKHIKPTIYFLSTRIMSTIYTLLDSVILGILTNNYAVGLYSTAIKLIRTATSLISSMSIVYFSDSSILSKENNERYQSLLSDLFSLLLLISLPTAIFTFTYSKEIILLFAGFDFEEASLSLMIMSPLILVSTITSFIGMQVLYASGKEKIVAQSLFIGAIVSVLMNVILIPMFSHNGAAIAVLTAELSVLIYQLINVTFVKVNLAFIFNRRVMNIMLANSIYLVVIYLFKNNVVLDDNIVFMITNIAVSVLSYLFILLLLKDSMVLSIKEKLIR
ncbi:flippase [Vibrio hangzhouensis]|uniref:Membrane protein involved in the export of O-antigen and teichoic acid n=1 Tax=Vibrio hangzhouensis TaxID=462991 RepID=A0A1H6BZ16_9VIBR|nr:flippase [Vibrio hangzhouensis]SEG65944.1 Membrane protein involved in the export of O-antigen and teichoic acid [Vibrio hangzhouensis]